MVRREEQPWQSRATLFIDNRAHVHRGAGPASSLEYAVSAAASIAIHLAQRGFRVRLISASGTSLGEGWHEAGASAAEAGPLLESLAVLRPSRRSASTPSAPTRPTARPGRRRSSATSPPPTRPWSTGCATRPRAPSRWCSTSTAGRAPPGREHEEPPGLRGLTASGLAGRDRRAPGPAARRKWREVGRRRTPQPRPGSACRDRAACPFHPTRVGVALLAAATLPHAAVVAGISGDPGAYLVPLFWICLLLALSGLALRSLRRPRGRRGRGPGAARRAGAQPPAGPAGLALGWMPTFESLRRDLCRARRGRPTAQDWSTPVPANVPAFPPLLVGRRRRPGAPRRGARRHRAPGAARRPAAARRLHRARSACSAGCPGWPSPWPRCPSRCCSPPSRPCASASGAAPLGRPARRERPAHRHRGGAALHAAARPRRGRGRRARGRDRPDPAAVRARAARPLRQRRGRRRGRRRAGAEQPDGRHAARPRAGLERPAASRSRPTTRRRTTCGSTVLDEFDGDAWRPSERDIPPTNRPTSSCRSPPGLTNATPKQAYRSSMVATEDFESQWLPTPYPAIDVAVSGDWRYDSETLDIVGLRTRSSPRPRSRASRSSPTPRPSSTPRCRRAASSVSAPSCPTTCPTSSSAPPRR